MVKGAWQATVPPEIGAQIKGIGLGWLWSSYNLMMVGIALLILLDIPRPNPYVWFDLRRVVRVTIAPDSANSVSITRWGITTSISEIGMEVAVTEGGLPDLALNSNLPVVLEIEEIQLKLTGKVSQIDFSDEFPIVTILFDPLSLQQQRQIVEMLFCRPGQWRRHESPGELKSLLILFQVLLRPRVLFERKVQAKPVIVAKT
jgi:cellulose synthase (UDP-forming)